MGFVEGKDKMVQLTYTFLFSRKDNIWNNVYDFEHDLTDFFKAKDLQAEAITFIDGSSGNKTLYIKDVSQEMTLKNDKKVDQQVLSPKKPEKSYKTTKRLVDSVNKSYGGK